MSRVVWGGANVLITDSVEFNNSSLNSKFVLRNSFNMLYIINFKSTTT